MRLRKEFFGDDLVQYSLLPSYLELLKQRGHNTSLFQRSNSTFDKLAIVFREGKKAFTPYFACGLAVDGTFIKTIVGGVLLVACFRNGNGELQIVACGVVSIENEENWSWFLRILFDNLECAPAFMISDRDKGLLPALAKVAPQIQHFYCFRHVMENFNKKFKSKTLRNLAWKVASSRSGKAYNDAAQELQTANPHALQWLLDIPLEKWSICHSPIPRFGVYTSNNVESINAVLKSIRKLPILDMLIEIERYVGSKWSENLSKSDGWNAFTKKAISRVEKCLRLATDYTVKQNSSSSFIVNILRRKEVPLEFAIDLSGDLNGNLCSCGYSKDMGAPCVHVLLSLKKTNRLAEMNNFFHPVWKTETFKEAYNEEQHGHVLPVVLKENVQQSVCHPPKIAKKKGRPRKKRRESQRASLQLNQPTKKAKKCGNCGGYGHNKRTCNS
jgi:hypothetical protein